MWLHSLKVTQLLRSAACLHTNHSRSYLNHLVCTQCPGMAVCYSSVMSCFRHTLFNNFLICLYGSSCPYCYWCHFCLYISHTLYFYLWFIHYYFIIIIIINISFLCIYTSKFLFQLPRCNNIIITLLYQVRKVKNFVLNAPHPGHTSRIMCLGFWVL